MSNSVRSIVSVGVAAAVFALLWPTLFWVAAAPAALLGIIVWLASGEGRGTRRWRQFALTGSAIGFVAGGVGSFLLVRLTGWGTSEGWESLQAIASGMVGAFAGAVVGLVTGLAAGLVLGEKLPPTGPQS